MEKQDLVINLLTQKSVLWVNLKIAKKVGITPAVVLAVLLEKYNYAFKENELVAFNDNHHFFKLSVTALSDELGLGVKATSNALAKLKKENLVFSQLSGIPATTFFCLNPIEVLKNY